MKKSLTCLGALLGESSLKPDLATSNIVATGQERQEKCPGWPVCADLMELLLLFCKSAGRERGDSRAKQRSQVLRQEAAAGTNANLVQEKVPELAKDVHRSVQNLGMRAALKGKDPSRDPGKLRHIGENRNRVGVVGQD